MKIDIIVRNLEISNAIGEAFYEFELKDRSESMEIYSFINNTSKR